MNPKTDSERRQEADRCLKDSRDLLNHIDKSGETTDVLIFENREQLDSIHEAMERAEDNRDFWARLRAYLRKE